MKPPPDEPLQSKRILVVEDNFVLADSLRWALESMGAKVIGPVYTCAQALQALEEHPIDVAILDIDLQGVPSTPVAKALHDSKLPFLFLTGFEDLELLPAELKEAPVLRKPVDPYIVAQLVLRLGAD